MKYACLPFLALASLTVSQVTPVSGGKYKFSTKYVKGQNFKYNMNVRFAGPQASNQSMSVIVKVLDVKPNGNKVIQTSTVYPGEKPQSVTMTLDKYGKPTDNNFGSFTGSLGLPLDAIKVGQKWTGDVQMAGGVAGGVPIKGNYTFVGISTVKGTRVATINFNMDMKALFNSTGSGTQVVRVSDGQLYSMNMVMNMDIPDQKTKKISKAKINMSVSLAK
ncbi:MAG: hypothetical protein WCK51_13005 [Armatimonadota bacterium]